MKFTDLFTTYTFGLELLESIADTMGDVPLSA